MNPAAEQQQYVGVTSWPITNHMRAHMHY